MTDTATDLLPCPFCGGDAEITNQDDEGQNNTYRVVGCVRCASEMRCLLAWTDENNDHDNFLISSWNTRTDSAEVIALRTERDAKHKAYCELADGTHERVSALRKRVEAADALEFACDRFADEDFHDANTPEVREFYRCIAAYRATGAA